MIRMNAKLRKSREVAMVQRELDRRGIPHALQLGGKHAWVEWRHAGQLRRVVVSVSSSDRKSGDIALATARRILREDRPA